MFFLFSQEHEAGDKYLQDTAGVENVTLEETQQESGEKIDIDNSVKMGITSNEKKIDASNLKIKIEKIDYSITGLTRRYPLQLAVPIDKTIIFQDEPSFLLYLDNTRQRLQNLRTIEESSIEYEYIGVEEDIALVHIRITTKDTWNIIAIPFPKYDSNKGFVAKIKGKDYNFLGSLQPLNLDIAYILDNDKASAGSIGLSFAYPFKAGPLGATYRLDTTMDIEKDRVGFDLNNAIEFSYPLKVLTVYFGYYQGFNLNKSRNEETRKKKQDEYNGEKEELDIRSTYDKYFFYSKFFSYTPIKLHTFDYAGELLYTPYISFHGNWAFKELIEREKRGIIGTFSHSLSISRIDWIGNFRKGFYFNLDNSYYYNFFLKDTPTVEVSTTLSGHYYLFDRIGIYSQFDAFYIFSKIPSQRAGKNLRGILNRRLITDTAITLNLDIPIRIYGFDFEKITGVEWTRFFGFELFISFFLDMAWVHDFKSNRYFHPVDGWYAGGIELIFYPYKMRSIYFRGSIGFDLSELKNVKGINKISGIAKRDGMSISEIFIGIGLHY